MRLTHPAFRPAAAPVEIAWNGASIEAFEGESVAAALAAAGIVELRRTRGGARRGLWCGMGACFDCLVTIDGRANQRACLAKAKAGMRVESGPPAAPAALAPPPAAAPAEHAVDVLVVGAGPAGLAAAIEAAEQLRVEGGGAGVVVLDERPAPGGQYFKPLGESQRFAGNRFPDRQFADGAALTRVAREAGVTILSEVAVWAAFAPDEIAALVDGRATLFRARRLILAPGAYERPVPIPGWTLPGVMTTGALQTLARGYRVSPGRRVIVAGNGPLNLQTAVELLRGNARVVAVVEAAEEPTRAAWRDVAALALAAPGLAREGRRLLKLLRQADVPVLWGRQVVAAEGDGRFARARLDDGTMLEADALALGHGFVPSTELARMLGLRHRFVDRHLGYLATEADADGRSSDRRVFVVGDGAEPGGARVALARGTLAGHAAARDVGGGPDSRAATRARRALPRAERFQRALWSLFAAPPVDVAAIADDTIVCRCEEITAGGVRGAISAGADALGAVKKLTRVGMGSCQGRYCAATCARILAAETATPLDEFALFAPRAPARPVPAGALAFEKPEWGGHAQVTPPPPAAARCARANEASAEHRADVLVIGGGALGCCTAWFLAREGIDVLVAERDAVNLQASGANAGSLHLQLLSFDFGARAQAGGGPAQATLPLGPESVRLWEEIARDTATDLEIRITGGLMVAETVAELAFLHDKAAAERAHGVATEVIGAAELRTLAPSLAANLAGAAFCPGEGKINPLTATYAVARGARLAGARFLAGADVTALAREGAGFVARTSAGTIRAGRVVVAAGAWSPRISAMLGVALPVKGAPLQMIVTEPAPGLVGHLVAHAGRHLSLKQADAGGLVIGGGWTAAADMTTGVTRTLRASIEGNLWVARRVLPALDSLHVVRTWAGMNVNIDGAPILGEAPGVPGLFHAVTSNGYTLAPVVGRLTADLIRTGRTARDVTPFLLARFG